MVKMSNTCKNHFDFCIISSINYFLSLIEPPGCTIIFTPAFIKVFMPSANGKNASDAATEFINLSG